VGIIAVAAMILFATRRAPVAEDNKGAPETDVAREVNRDLSQPELTEEQRQEMAAWREEGFVVDLWESSHEVFVDPAKWEELTRAEKETRVRKFSLYLKTFDGTNQVIVRTGGDKQWLADYFADTIRVK
jgi:hypothetical protein